MLWTTESNEERNARKNAALIPQWEYERNWHPWFAWYPVFVEPKRKAWLTYVERRLGGWERNEKPKWWTWDIRYFSYEYRPLPKNVS